MIDAVPYEMDTWKSTNPVKWTVAKSETLVCGQSDMRGRPGSWASPPFKIEIIYVEAHAGGAGFLANGIIYIRYVADIFRFTGNPQVRCGIMELSHGAIR